MSESEHGVLHCAPGGVPGEPLVEHVDQANPLVPLQRVLHRRRRDGLVVGGPDLSNGFEPDDPVGKTFDQLDHPEYTVDPAHLLLITRFA